MKAKDKYSDKELEGKIKVNVDTYALIEVLSELSANIGKLRLKKNG